MEQAWEVTADAWIGYSILTMALGGIKKPDSGQPAKLTPIFQERWRAL